MKLTAKKDGTGLLVALDGELNTLPALELSLNKAGAFKEFIKHINFI